VDVLEEAQQIGFPVTQNGLIAPLEEMANGFIFAVEVQRVALIDALEDL